MRRLRLAPILAVVLLTAARATHAEDGPAVAPGRIDLVDLRAPAAAVGPRLYAPSDAAFPGFDVAEVPADTVLAKFQEPPHPLHAFSLDQVEDLVKRLVPEAAEGAGSFRLAGDGIDVWATSSVLERTRAATRDVTSRLAPRLSVSASLTDGGALVGAGAASLPSRRWTPLWLRRDVRRAVVGFEAEVATESVANLPVVTALPEGTECYVRWSPGERVSLVEAWVGALAHAGETEVDLSPVRNVPESNSMGTARLPRTSIARASTAVAVPVDAPSEAVISLTVGGRVLLLRLAVAAEPARDAADPKAGAGVYGVVRLAALGAPLEAGARPSRVDEVLRRLQAVDARAGAEGRGAEAFDQTFAGIEGPAPRVARLRADVAAEEERLAGVSLDLRAVPVPEGDLAQAFASGRLAVGRALAADAVPAGEPTSAARLPLVSAVSASVRAGTSVTGFAELPVSIADRAGGLAATPVGRFDGLAATVRGVRAADGSWTLSIVGDLSWAKADGARANLAFRAPLAMAYRTYNPNPEDATVRRVEVPLLTEGRSAVDATLRFAAADVAEGRPLLAAVLARPAGPSGPAAVLLVASLRR
jgi:hypothetical protein